MVMPDPWGFLPESFKIENRAMATARSLDFENSFVSTSNIPTNGIGKQMNVLYNLLSYLEVGITYVQKVYAVLDPIVEAYQNFINKNPDDFAVFEFNKDIFDAKILVHGEDYEILVRFTTVALEIYYDAQEDTCTGRIQINDSTAIKYGIKEDYLFVAAEAMRRIHLLGEDKRILVLAHTNPLVAQLEQAFWPFLKASQSTLIWNGNERPTSEQLRNTDMVFACVDTVFEAGKRGEVYDFDVVIVDECHHAGSSTYQRVLELYNAGEKDGAFLLGLTATPWRPDDSDIREIFGDPRISIDMVYGISLYEVFAKCAIRLYAEVRKGIETRN
jgi:hypothetical protein